MSAMNPQQGAALQNPAICQMMTSPDFLRQMSDPNTVNVRNYVHSLFVVL
jgi:hypothetical protein